LQTRHEIAGIVKEVGSNVHRFKVGDHVGVGTYVNSCRDCEYCNDGQEVVCARGSVFTFNGVDADGTITKGGYSSYIVVHERQVFSDAKLCYLPLFYLNIDCNCRRKRAPTPRTLLNV